MVSNVHESNLDAFHTYLKEVYKETRVVKGRVLDYVGISFDFTKFPMDSDPLSLCDRARRAVQSR